MSMDCASVRKSLQKYQSGHLFKHQQVRISRHLGACPVCRSEFQALQKVADTRQLLKDLAPADGMGRHLRSGGAFFAKLAVLFYRPLWLLLIIGGLTLLYVNLVAPRRDVEIENLERTIPPSAAAVSAPTQSLPQEPAAGGGIAGAGSEPLTVTFVPHDDGSVGRINDILHGNAELRKKRFSAAQEEIAGSLAVPDLQALLGQVGQVAKVSYSRKQLETIPQGERVHFVFRLKAAPKPAAARTRTVPASSAASPAPHGQATPVQEQHDPAPPAAPPAGQ